MTSDEKDDKNLGLEENTEAGNAGGEVVENETPLEIEPEIDEVSAEVLSASVPPELEPELEDDFGQDLDVDITGDENIDFADEDGGLSGGGGFALKKMMAPIMVLVIAAGAGGYIVMNPQILGQGTATELPQPETPYVVQAPEFSPFSAATAPQDKAPAQAVEDITEGSSFAQVPDDSFSDSLPQPTVNQNEASPVPVEVAEMVPEIPEVDQVTEIAPPQPENVLEVPVAPSVLEEQSVADELFDLKFSEEKEAVSEAAELTPMEPMPFDAPDDLMSPPVADEAFDVAQVDVAEVTEVEPPVISPVTPEVTEAPAKPVAAFKEEVQEVAALPVDSSNIASASETYFDGRVPTGPMAAAVGLREVDPVLEPATQYVVVNKTHEAQNPEALLVSANRALKLKRYESALDMFDQLYKKNSRDPRILMGRAVAQQNSGRIESAIRSYEEVLDVKPNDADAMLNMLGLLRQQYPSVALRRLMDLHEKHPNNAGIAAQIGITQADLGHYDDAMRYLGIASSMEPKNAQHAFNMAIIADRNGDAKSAVKHYEQALEMDAIYSSGRSIPRDTIYDRLSILRRR